jgi:hypothetical protein
LARRSEAVPPAMTKPSSPAAANPLQRRFQSGFVMPSSRRERRPLESRTDGGSDLK